MCSGRLHQSVCVGVCVICSFFFLPRPFHLWLLPYYWFHHSIHVNDSGHYMPSSAISLKTQMLNFPAAASTWTFSQCFQCLILLKKKILNLLSLPSFSMCVNGGMAVPGCVGVCTCMGVLWGVGKEICEKLSHRRLFSHLTPVSQHVPGHWSLSIPLGLASSRGPFCHCLHQYS